MDTAYPVGMPQLDANQQYLAPKRIEKWEICLSVSHYLNFLDSLSSIPNCIKGSNAYDIYFTNQLVHSDKPFWL